MSLLIQETYFDMIPSNAPIIDYPVHGSPSFHIDHHQLVYLSIILDLGLTTYIYIVSVYCDSHQVISFHYFLGRVHMSK